jgi:glycosyltransferase involved in cell wall biosynthesis
MIDREAREERADPTSAPLISVIIVVRNGAATLERALESIFSRQFAEMECILIDGNSTDGTLDIVKKYNEQIAYWISEPDGGIYDAMNKGVTHAKGRYVYFLGCDDFIEVNPRELEHWLKDENTIYYGNALRTNYSKPYDGVFNSWKLTRSNICHQAIFYPRTFFKTRQFSIQYKVFADWEFNLRCYGDKGCKFQYIPLTIATWSDGGFSSVSTDPQFDMDRDQIFKQCLPRSIYWLYRLRQRVKKLFLKAAGMSR